MSTNEVTMTELSDQDLDATVGGIDGNQALAIGMGVAAVALAMTGFGVAAAAAIATTYACDIALALNG